MKSRLIFLLFALQLLGACGASDTTPAATPATTAGSLDGTAPSPSTLPAQQVAPVAGTDYFELPQGAPYAPLNGQVEVAEVFGYTCGHCANFEPLLVAWKQTLPPDVRVTPVPAALGGYWVTYAQAFHAAEQMGIREKSHQAMFDALHLQNTLSPTSTPDEIAAFYAQYGVDAKVFAETMQGAAVGARINQSREFAIRSRIEGTPSLIIDGKYLVAADQRGYEPMLRTATYLVAQQRAALK